MENNTQVNLQRLRVNRGLKVKDVASDLKISPSLISRIENGDIDITPKTAKLLSDYYGVEVKPMRRVKKFVEGSQKKITKKSVEAPLKQRLAEIKSEKNETIQSLKQEIAELKEQSKAEYQTLKKEKAVVDRKYNLLRKKYINLLATLSDFACEVGNKFTKSLVDIDKIGDENSPVIEENVEDELPLETDDVEVITDENPTIE